MSVVRQTSADGLTLLRRVVRRPIDYGLEHRHESLQSVLEFAIAHPNCVGDAESSATRKIERSREGSRNGRSEASRIHDLIRRQLLRAKEELAWTDLDHRLRVESCCWNVDRYAWLAKCLGVLAALWRYQHLRFTQVSLYSVNTVATRLGRLWRLKRRGWKAVQDHLSQCGLDWQVAVVARLSEVAEPHSPIGGGTLKTLRRDRDGSAWILKYSPESLMNPVLASLFSRMTGCPGAEICPSFLDYDPRKKRPCSIQPVIKAQQVLRLDYLSKAQLIRLVNGRRQFASQMLCQAVTQWMLENIDGNQMIVDTYGNCVAIDQDRSFFIDDHRVTTDWQAAWEARTKKRSAIIRAELIEAALPIPGVLYDLSAYVDRIEAIPTAVYEGLVRNASFREEQLDCLFYLDTIGRRALESVEALERWIAHLVGRKLTVRTALARRMCEVLGTTEEYLGIST